jgi:hypothetical protein
LSSQRKTISLVNKPLLSRLDALTYEEKMSIVEYLKSSLEDSHYEAPLSIFDNGKISALEAIVKYLREEKGLSFIRISRITNRSDKTIWITYSQAKKKMPEKFKAVRSSLSIPIQIIADRKISVLENIVVYLKSSGMSYYDIAKSINRNYATVVTVCNRARKKGVEIE